MGAPEVYIFSKEDYSNACAQLGCGYLKPTWKEKFMQRMFFKVVALSLGIAGSVVAYQNAPPKTKAPRKGDIQGTVRSISKDKSEITVHTSQAVDRIIIYSAGTKLGYGSSKKNTPNSVDKLQEGYFLNCSGTYQDVRLAATNCYFREQR